MFISAKKGLLLTILIAAFIIMESLPIRAADNQFYLKNETINPGSFYYQFKRLWEKGVERLQFSEQSRINFYKSQFDSRLSELNYVVNKKLLSEIQTSSERFAYQAGILTDEQVKDNKDKDESLGRFKQVQKFLESLRDHYPANSSYWMLIQHDINSLAILSDKLR